MWLGMLIGGGLGWVAVQHTADGTMARFLVDDRSAWLYVAALAAVLAIGVAANPRLVGGLAGGLAVGLGIAAAVTLRPQSAASADLGAPLGVGAAMALAAALAAGMTGGSGDRRHPVRRPWSRRARRARALQARP